MNRDEQLAPDSEPHPCIADTVLRSGRFCTLCASSPWAEAVAIKSGRIVYVGSNERVSAYLGTETRLIDLGGRFAMPGFNDAHIHFAPNMLRSLCEDGITTIQSINSVEEFDQIIQVAEAGELAVRVDVRLPIEEWPRYHEHCAKTKSANGMVRVIGLKGYVDGLLREKTAYVLNSYLDKADLHGELTQFASNPRQLAEILQNASQTGADLTLHAIGDAAVRVALDQYERLSELKPGADHRHRIAHATLVSAQDLHRFGRSGIIAEVNPYHVNALPWLSRLVNEKSMRWAFPFRSLMNHGASLCFGSDYPGLAHQGEFPLSPLKGIQAAVLHPHVHERLTLSEALTAYTIAPAFAARSENERGTLEPGKMADIIVLSENPFEVSANTIGQVQVDLTLLGGTIRFQR